MVVISVRKMSADIEFSSEQRQMYFIELDELEERGEIFWSDDEEPFVSSGNTEIITIASDSETNDCKITIFEAFEDNENWGGDEMGIELQKQIPLKFKICWTCNIRATTMLQCTICWSNKRQGACRPMNKKQKRKKLMSKDAKTSNIDIKNSLEDLCQLCCNNKKDGGFVHNTSCHFLCCYQCCKTIFEQKGRCPYCCRIIEKIIRIRC